MSCNLNESFSNGQVTQEDFRLAVLDQDFVDTKKKEKYNIVLRGSN